MGQVVHGQVAVDVGVEVERRVSWTLVCKELMGCRVQVPRRQSGGAQSCCTAVHAALVTHVTLTRVLHLLHLNMETQNIHGTCLDLDLYLYCNYIPPLPSNYLDILSESMFKYYTDKNMSSFRNGLKKKPCGAREMNYFVHAVIGKFWR